MTTEQLPGLQMAIALLAQIGDDDSDRAIAAVHAAADERDELRAKYDELLVALHGIGAALGIPEGDRSPYSVTCGVLERVNRLAEIEAQEPVALVETSGDQGAGIGWSGAAQPVGAKLYARPVPAQAAPDGWQLVPVEPTPEMEEAGDRWTTFPLTVWMDMIDAAPEHKA